MKFRSGLLTLLLSLTMTSAAFAGGEPDTEPAAAPAPATTEAAPTAPAEAVAVAPVEAAPAEAAPVEAAAAPAESTPAPAEAAPSAGPGRNYYVSPMFSYTLADKDRGTKNGYGGVIAVGKRMTDGLNLEINAMYTQLDAKSGGGKAKLKGAGVTALVFPLSTFPNAYGLLGVSYGTAENHPGPVPSYHTTIFDSGIGYLFPITQRVLLRTEARYRMDSHGREQAGIHSGDRSAFYEGVFNVGLLMPLGVAPVAAPAPVEEVAVAPPVETAPVPPPAGPLDSDGDGVPDDIDECPHTPAGAKVLANGCALVGDCRTPRAGEPVDANGCAANTFILKGVNFEFDSDRLTDEAKEILNQVADTLKSYAEIKVEVAGHTDDVGSEGYNQGLSERRANSVKAYLGGRGVNVTRMTPVGYGKSQPVVQGTTEEDRAKNRRVELRVKE